MSTALAAARAKTKGKRMLREALEGYGEDAYTLSEWNSIKHQAERDGKWRWKASDATATLAAVKDRIQKDVTQELLDLKFATDLEAVMAAELRTEGKTKKENTDAAGSNQCAWRERISGKQFACTNDLPLERGKRGRRDTKGIPENELDKQHRLCKWHARECGYSDHPIEKSRAIEIPNDQGYCLHCYESTALGERGTLQKAPPRVPLTKIPGVCEVNLKRSVLRESLLKGGKRRKGEVDTDGLSRRLTAKSACAWEKEHSESAFIWQCRNFVAMHPTLRGAYLPFCGYHAPRCILEYGGFRKKTSSCPPIDRRNPFGMCRNHVEAHLSTLTFESRAKCVFADSDFDVPGIIECRRDRLKPKPKRHPLAPKDPPPSSGAILDLDAALDRFVVVKAHMNPSRWDRFRHQWIAAQLAVMGTINATLGPAIFGFLNHSNPVSALLKEAIWRFQFMRRGDAVATRVQRIFRGNRARRRVRAMSFEQAALRRMRACVKIQRIARGFLGRLAFAHEAEAVKAAVPNIQRIVRGGLGRLRTRRLRATLCLQRNFRAYRQRCFAWALREEIEYMRALQRQADANYQEMLVQLEAFRRVRARRVLRAHVARWRRRKEEQARLAYERLQALLSAIKVQRAFRRHQHYKQLKLRYVSAQQIQKRVRGWLTRHMWRDHPGLLWITSFIRVESGFKYGKVIVLSQPTGSYAYPTLRIRMQYGALAIQRAYRGFMGRLVANMRWVAMLKRWEWLSLDSTGESTDSMTLGHQRYGFLLPSYNYHHEKRRHMLPIKRGIKPDRGFAYKYQSILELIQDRDGKRAWSLAKEEKWKRNKGKSLLLKRSESADTPGKETRHKAGEVVDEKAVGIAHAIFPVGCLVLVASTNRRDSKRYHKARVTAVHCDPTRESNASTVDVEYLNSFLSIRGVRMYNEPHVPLTRLRPAGPMTQDEGLHRPGRRSVGKLIESAIQQLKAEIQASREMGFGKSKIPIIDEPSSIALATIDEIADRLRDDEPHTDLLIDQRDFVNFVFKNSAILRIKWLQVIDHIRRGTREKELPPLPPSPVQANFPLTPSLLSFYREFGFDAVKKMQHVIPMPDRAGEIEVRMTQLGFLHDPSTNIRDQLKDQTGCRNQRPQTTPSQVETDREKKTRGQTRDDLAVADLAATTPSSAQDLHRLIYELKTLPRERHREKIIEVTTRHARSFICGFPACGRCFSSHEAARLHQEGVHLHQRRLATAAPMIDQYLHAYWPPTSPWNQEHNRSFAPSVGYYRCSHAECDGRDGQFRTRRELQRHMLKVHRVHSPCSIDPTIERQDRANTVPLRSEAAVSSQIWLGTYVLCRNYLEKRIDGFRPTASWHGSDEIHCDVHHLSQADPERCRDCFARSRRIILPCRLYKAVALPGSRVSCPTQQHLDGNEESLNVEGYVIFSVEDPLLCPVVREHDLISLDEGDKDRKKRLARLYASRKVKQHDFQNTASVLVALRLLALCRDANGVSWVIGQVFQPVPLPLQTRSDSVLTPSTADSYEVTLDEAHIVAAVLDDVRAVCIVHRCGKTEFLRKHFRRDDPTEMRKLGEQRAKTSTGHRYLRVTLERFWRDGVVHDENDDV